MAQFTLRLFHGRDDPDAHLADWGFDGPVLGPFDSIRFTYGSLLLFFDERLCELRRVDDLLFYDGKFYGDATVELAREAPPTEQFDDAKAARRPLRMALVPTLIALRPSELRDYRACVEVFIDAVNERISERAGLACTHALRRIARQP